MKHPADIAGPGFEPRCYRSVANRATSQATEAPVLYDVRVGRSSFCIEIPQQNTVVSTCYVCIAVCDDYDDDDDDDDDDVDDDECHVASYQSVIQGVLRPAVNQLQIKFQMLPVFFKAE